MVLCLFTETFFPIPLVLYRRDSEGGGDSVFVRELGGTSDNNCNGTALISSSQKRRSTRSNRSAITSDDEEESSDWCLTVKVK